MFSKPKKSKKNRRKRGKKSTVGTLSKKWLFGLFCREERKANRRNGNQKYLCKDRKNCLGEKSRGCCLQHACVIPRHLFSAEQEQLRGEKCLVVLVGQKEGHMIRYGQKEKEKKWEKYTVKGKTIVIGYAYLSQGKHITSDLNRLFKNQNTKEEIKQRQKRWNTNLVNQTGQIRKVCNGIWCR